MHPMSRCSSDRQTLHLKAYSMTVSAGGSLVQDMREACVKVWLLMYSISMYTCSMYCNCLYIAAL